MFTKIWHFTHSAENFRIISKSRGLNFAKICHKFNNRLYLLSFTINSLSSLAVNVHLRIVVVSLHILVFFAIRCE